MSSLTFRKFLLLFLWSVIAATAFVPSVRRVSTGSPVSRSHRHHVELTATQSEPDVGLSRRSALELSVFVLPLFVSSAFALPQAAAAAQRPSLSSLIYKILRVREATQQETRLITSGKFKDVQRANVKLAIKFMLENYRLQDAFVAASGYLDGNQRRVEAGQVGQAAVQNLYTILEYFDSADVQNLKVSTYR